MPIHPNSVRPLTDADLVPSEEEAFIDIYYTRSGDYLYHYTSQAAFLAILETHRVRATDIRFLNDAQEFRHARTVAAKVIGDLSAEVPPEEKSFLESLVLDDVYSLGLVPTAFIFSLSELPDDLSQWRAYCPAGGFALGFETRRLVTAASVQGFRLAKCLYDDAEQRTAVRNLLDVALTRFRSPPDRSKAREQFADDFLELAPMLKNHAFRAEREWRLISTPRRYSEPAEMGMKIREGRYTPVPFVEIDLDIRHLDKAALDRHLGAAPILWPIPKVTIGPSPNPDLAHISASVALLRQCPIRDIVDVNHSTIPYRNWI